MEKDIQMIVKGVSLVTRKSKAGNDYTVLRVTFENGYHIDNFLTQDQLFIVRGLVDSADILED